MEELPNRVRKSIFHRAIATVIVAALLPKSRLYSNTAQITLNLVHFERLLRVRARPEYSGVKCQNTEKVSVLVALLAWA